MSVVSYAQSGEDLQLAHLLGSVSEVSYIDVGCLWPRDHSNSFYFYERGGSGLCIDANPAVEAEFNAERPRDTFLSSGLGQEAGRLVYHTFRNPVFNTFSAEIAAKRQAQGERDGASLPSGRTLVEMVDVPIMTLDMAIQTEKPAYLDREWIDFLSIDVEGFELAVLRGFSFRPRPRVVLIEDLSRRDGVADLSQLPISAHLSRHGYSLAGFLGHNFYFS